MTKQTNGMYVLDYTLIVTQNKILNVYGVNPKTIPDKVKYIGLELKNN